MTEKQLLIALPFDGFYASYSTDIIEQEHESEIDNLELNDADTDALNEMYQFNDFKKIYLEYAKLYVEAFEKWLNNETNLKHEVAFEFESLTSPREYNFETDKIYARIKLSDVLFMFENTKKETLTAVCKELFTSRDGFISHYDAEWITWGHVSTWDHNQVKALLYAFMNDHTDHYLAITEFTTLPPIYDIMEDARCNGDLLNMLNENYAPEYKTQIEILQEKYGV